MGRRYRYLWIPLISLLLLVPVFGQQADSNQQKVEELFAKANALADNKNYPDALKLYREALKLAPKDESILFNAGVMAYLSGDFRSSVDLWEQLAKINPDDWAAQSKLVQAYQALGDSKARDEHRTKLFEMRRKGTSPELSKKESYCREQFKVDGTGVFVLEHFEMTGDRARRYEFIVLNSTGEEDYTISLGSYDLTNAIWAESNKKLAAKGQRLFHLDGYFKNAHATYGFYTPEPSYDQVRGDVVKILEKKSQPVSSSSSTPNGADVVIKK